MSEREMTEEDAAVCERIQETADAIRASLVEWSGSGHGRPRLMSIEDLVEMGIAARATMTQAELELFEIMTPERSIEVRALRIGSNGEVARSWRDIAQACWWNWGGEWEPRSSQIQGMAICKIAAIAHGENYRERPWN